MADATGALEKIGVVEGFFARPSAAVIKVTKGTLKAGERIYIKGHTTDLQQTVLSMQVDRKEIAEAKKGDVIGIQVERRVRPNDIVYRLPCAGD